MSAQARTAAAGEAMTVLRADAPAASWLERYPLGDDGLGAGGSVARPGVRVDVSWADDFIPGRGPGERTNEA